MNIENTSEAIRGLRAKLDLDIFECDRCTLSDEEIKQILAPFQVGSNNQYTGQEIYISTAGVHDGPYNKMMDECQQYIKENET